MSINVFNENNLLYNTTLVNFIQIKNFSLCKQKQLKCVHASIKWI